MHVGRFENQFLLRDGYAGHVIDAFGHFVVGGSLVGDVLADKAIVRKNALPDDDPLRNADPSYELRSVLAVPLVAHRSKPRLASR